MQYYSETLLVTSYCDNVDLPSQGSELEGLASLILNGYSKVDAL
jgi:hypothetical protein